MRIKRHLVAMALGAGAVWFTHPVLGEQRRRRASDKIRRAESTAKTVADRAESTAKTVADVVTPDSTPSPTLQAPATLTEVVDAAKRSGYGADFATTPDAKVRCGTCEHQADPDDYARAWMHRLEGPSDPDDMMTVSALRCPSCGAKGLLVLPFGPSADEVEGDVSRRLREPEEADMAPLRNSAVTV